MLIKIVAMFRNLLISSFDATTRKRALHPAPASRGFASHVFLVRENIYPEQREKVHWMNLSLQVLKSTMHFRLFASRLLSCVVARGGRNSASDISPFCLYPFLITSTRLSAPHPRQCLCASWFWTQIHNYPRLAVFGSTEMPNLKVTIFFTRDALKGHTVSKNGSISFFFFSFLVVTNRYINLFIKLSPLLLGMYCSDCLQQQQANQNPFLSLISRGRGPTHPYLCDVNASFDIFIKDWLNCRAILF